MKLVVYITFTVATLATTTVLFATVAATEKSLNEVLSTAANRSVKNVTKTSPSKRLNNIGQDEIIETKSISQKLLESWDDLRDYISYHIDQIYEIRTQLAKSTDTQNVLSLDVDEIPPIANVFYVGKFNKTYKLADMQYTNVRVYGMSDFKNYTLSVDQNNRKVAVTLVANQLTIEGNYLLSNFLKHASGSFTVKLLDNVTYTENDLYCKFKDEFDIAAGEATVTFGRSEYNYQNMGVISILFEGDISNKLTEEILYRVGKVLGHRIRHVIISKIKQITSGRDATSAGQYNRITSIVGSSLSQIRTWINKTNAAVKVPLTGIFYKMKVHDHTIPVSNLTLTGLNTMHLSQQIKTFRKKGNFYIGMEGEAGPVVIKGRITMAEVRNGKLEQIPLNVNYEVSQVWAKIVVSNSLSDDHDLLEVTHMDLNISQPNVVMQSCKIDFKPEELKQLAEFLKPDVEAELYKWLKNFVNDVFRRTSKSTPPAPSLTPTATTSSHRSLLRNDDPPDTNPDQFYS